MKNLCSEEEGLPATDVCKWLVIFFNGERGSCKKASAKKRRERYFMQRTQWVDENSFTACTN
jgi:hypothetical protein